MRRPGRNTPPAATSRASRAQPALSASAIWRNQPLQDLAQLRRFAAAGPPARRREIPPNLAGGNSAGSCCTRIRIWRHGTTAGVRPLSMAAGDGRRAPGLAAGPYRLPDGRRRACASSGRPGWMHNRVRMAAASFLVKNLLADWRQGEAWFWDTLVDADAGQQSCQLAVGGGLRGRRVAVFPGLQSGYAGQEVRPGREVRRTLGAGARAAAGSLDPSAVEGDAA